MFVWIAYAPFLTDVPNFGVPYGLTFLGSAFGAWTSSSFDPKRAAVVGNGVVVLATTVCMFESEAVFALMTVSNFARGVNGAHAQARALLCTSSTGTMYGLFHCARMAVTSAAVFACSATYVEGSRVQLWLIVLLCTIGACFGVSIPNNGGWGGCGSGAPFVRPACEHAWIGVRGGVVLCGEICMLSIQNESRGAL